MSRVRGSLRAPEALAVRTVEIDGERFAIFEWPTPAPDLGVLSPAERAVLALVIKGHSNAEIAAARTCSERTVANQVASLRKKLGASSRFDLIRWYGA